MQEDSLFDIGGPVRPARRKPGRKPTKLCYEEGCTNFTRQQSGSRYCIDHSRMIDGVATDRGAQIRQVIASCARCGNEYDQAKRRLLPTAQTFYGFCPDCRADSPLTWEQVKNQHVPPVMLHSWLMRGRDLRCDLCGDQLSVPRVDHDHGHCPVGRSCGQCIRGLLCPSCNNVVGYIEKLRRVVEWSVIEEYITK